MKVTGTEFKIWIATAWPDGYHWLDVPLLEDGNDLYLDGVLNVADDKLFKIPPDWWLTTESIQSEERMLQVLMLVARWRQIQTKEKITVLVPQAQAASIRCELSHRGFIVN